MEGWPPELAQYVAYDGWLDAKDIMSLCCASQVMCDLLLGDAYAQSEYKAFASTAQLMERGEHDAVYKAILRKSAVLERGMFYWALDALNDRLLRLLFKRGWFYVDEEPGFIEKSISQERYLDVVLENVDMDDQQVQTRIVKGYCIAGNVERAVHYLERFGADTPGMWPLHWACRSSSVELVELFIDMGIDQFDDISYTPFMYACASPHMEVFIYLMEHLLPLASLRNAKGATTILYCDDEAVVLQKLEYLSRRRCLGLVEGLMHKACRRSSANVVAYLLQQEGTDVNECIEGRTPLSVGCSSDRLEIVEMLLADPRVDLNAHNCKALYLCVNWSGYESFCRLLQDDRLCCSADVVSHALHAYDNRYIKGLVERFGAAHINELYKLHEGFATAWSNTKRYLLTLDELDLSEIPRNLICLPKDIQETVKARFT